MLKISVRRENENDVVLRDYQKEAIEAREIVQKDMRRSEESSYLQDIWDGSIDIRNYYSSFNTFARLIHTQTVEMLQ